MTEDEVLEKFGMPPRPAQVEAIRTQLKAETLLEAEASGNTETMKALCTQLFMIGCVQDALLIWRAKVASWDSSFSIDVALLCGAGLKATFDFLGASDDAYAKDALERLEVYRASEDFEDFSVAGHSVYYLKYYCG